MSTAGQDRAARRAGPRRSASDEAETVAQAYIAEAGGDARAALVEAVKDGFAVAKLVSRGFARWGPPDRGVPDA